MIMLKALSDNYRKVTDIVMMSEVFFSNYCYWKKLAIQLEDILNNQLLMLKNNKIKTSEFYNEEYFSGSEKYAS